MGLSVYHGGPARSVSGERIDAAGITRDRVYYQERREVPRKLATRVRILETNKNN